jgi:hypothetical protein
VRAEHLILDRGFALIVAGVLGVDRRRERLAVLGRDHHAALVHDQRRDDRRNLAVEDLPPDELFAVFLDQPVGRMLAQFTDQMVGAK